MVLSGSAVHAMASDRTLCSTRKRLIAACRSTIDRKTPRFSRRRSDADTVRDIPVRISQTRMRRKPREFLFDSNVRLHPLESLGCVWRAPIFGCGGIAVDTLMALHVLGEIHIWCLTRGDWLPRWMFKCRTCLNISVCSSR
jgi:hypothetical protein